MIFLARPLMTTVRYQEETNANCIASSTDPASSNGDMDPMLRVVFAFTCVKL